jgi:hypothetical protein
MKKTDPRLGLGPRDEDLPAEKRDELIADYQAIVDEAAAGAEIGLGMVKFAEGRLCELRQAAQTNG